MNLRTRTKMPVHPQPRPWGTRALLLLAAAALGCQTPGAAQEAVPEPTFAPAGQQFDLLLYGFDFDPGEHQVFLRTNLDYGGEWVSLGTIDVKDGDGHWRTAVFTGLSARRFLGQDFREMFLDLRIDTDGDGSRISAIYATPHVPDVADHAAALTRLIEKRPGTVRAASLASHVQPSAARLVPGTPCLEHVRAPMKHTPPGIAEVKQLQVEWRNRAG